MSVQITKIDITPVSVPYFEPVVWRFGQMRGITSAVIRVSTDFGVEGLGEAPGVPCIGIVLEALEFFRPAFVNQDPANIKQLMHKVSEAGAAHFPYVANVVLSGIEMALWDICGKTLGCPVYQLFGGLGSRALPFYWHVNVPDERTETAVQRALEGLRLGFRTMYLKGGSDIERDLNLIEAIRSGVTDDVALRLDPNEGWAYLDAVKRERRLQDVALEFLEEPFEMHDLDRMREFRERSGIPIAANQSAWLLRDVRAILASRSADVIVTGVCQAGGMLNLNTAADMCELSGVPLVRHSLCDLGIGTAAALAVLASRPSTQLAHQTHLQLVEHDLLESPWQFVDGTLEVRNGSGLGVELDVQALQRYARNYQEMGEYGGYSIK